MYEYLPYLPSFDPQIGCRAENQTTCQNAEGFGTTENVNVKV